MQLTLASKYEGLQHYFNKDPRAKETEENKNIFSSI